VTPHSNARLSGNREANDSPPYPCRVHATRRQDGQATPDREQVSVVIPTIGRVALLRECLDSLAACRPGPAEVVVVDQSGGPEVAELVAEYSRLCARVVESEVRGVSAARNAGLEAAGHDLVFMTDDDCTVAPDWVGVSTRLTAGDPRVIVTGRVLAMGDDSSVPSTIAGLERHDHTGTARYFVLYTGNMAMSRREVLALGGFDEALRTAEDNDLCYRWLTSGRRLIYEPEMVVWHHDWRSPEELELVYVSYCRGQGAVYAKHICAGDVRMLYFLLREVYWSARVGVWKLIGRPRPNTETRRGALRALAAGFIEYVRRRRAPGPPAGVSGA
jgi:GT2 family glycosyltransferase